KSQSCREAAQSLSDWQVARQALATQWDIGPQSASARQATQRERAWSHTSPTLQSSELLQVSIATHVPATQSALVPQSEACRHGPPAAVAGPHSRPEARQSLSERPAPVVVPPSLPTPPPEQPASRTTAAAMRCRTPLVMAAPFYHVSVDERRASHRV